MYLIGQMVLITYVPLYLKDTMGYSAYWASQALALTQSGAMIGRVGWGIASDRLFGGRRKIVLIVIGLLSVILIGGFGFIDRDSSSVLLMAMLFFAGVCIVGYQGVSYALIGEIAGKARTGAALGMMITINAGAATLGTPLFGHIVDRTGSYAIGWRMLAGAIAVGIVGMAVLLKEPRLQPGAQQYKWAMRISVSRPMAGCVALCSVAEGGSRNGGGVQRPSFGRGGASMAVQSSGASDSTIGLPLNPAISRSISAGHCRRRPRRRDDRGLVFFRRHS